MGDEQELVVLAIEDNAIILECPEDRLENSIPTMTQEEFDTMLADDKLFADIGISNSKVDEAVLATIHKKKDNLVELIESDFVEDDLLFIDD